MNLTNDDVQEILRLLDASPFDELILETDRFKLTLRKQHARRLDAGTADACQGSRLWRRFGCARWSSDSAGRASDTRAT